MGLIGMNCGALNALKFSSVMPVSMVWVVMNWGGGAALILVGVIPAILVGSSKIVVVVGEVVHEEFALAGVFLVVVVAVVVGFGGHFGRLVAHVVEGVGGRSGRKECRVRGRGSVGGEDSREFSRSLGRLTRSETLLGRSAARRGSHRHCHCDRHFQGTVVGLGIQNSLEGGVGGGCGDCGLRCGWCRRISCCREVM